MPKTDVIYPPLNDVERVTRYICREKKVPGSLPDTILTKKDYPTQLLPEETTCQLCPDGTALAKPVLISKTACIITMNGVIECKCNANYLIFYINLFFFVAPHYYKVGQ